MIANIGGGMLMWLVHFLNKFIQTSDYGVFGIFLTVVMLLPTIPLQMVFAQQTAKAIALNNEASFRFDSAGCGRVRCSSGCGPC